MPVPIPDSHHSPIEHALWYARQGFLVTPYHNANKRGQCSCGDSECPKPGKHPRLKDFQARATTDEAKIREWWSQWPWANITLITGVDSGLVVFDFDGAEGYETAKRIQAKLGKFPTTASSYSGGGGLHVWFRHPGQGIYVPSGDGLLGPNGDVKADGGWITVPPSMHASGQPYTWGAALDDTPMALLPGWAPGAIDHAKETGETIIKERSSGEPHSYRRRFTGTRYELPGSIISGGRNEELYRYGCSLRARGAERGELQTALDEVNQARCSPPLTPRELEWIVKSVLRHPPGEKMERSSSPRTVSRSGPPEPPWFEDLSTEPPPPDDPAFAGLQNEPPSSSSQPTGSAAPDIPWDPQDPPEYGGGGGGGGGNGGGRPPGGEPPGPSPSQGVLLAGPDGIPMTDIGNAERIFKGRGEDLRHVGVMQRWYVFDGARWAHDTRNESNRIAGITARRLHKLYGQCRDEPHQKAWRRHIKGAESAGGITSALKCLAMHRQVSISPEKLDANTQDWFNCPNGMLDLRTMRLHSHRREPMVTKIAPVPFDAEAKCPRWLEFLDEIMGGDKELIGFLQRAVGYAMTGHTTEQCLFFLYGRGRNGKSTFVETIRAMLGDYGSHTDFATFLDRPGDTARADLARLRGDRMVTAGEPPLGKRFDEGVVKAMTGGDRITCRHLYGDFFEYTPEYKIFLCANVKPTIRGQDDGIWRRFRLIPFTVQIPEERKDLQLGAKLRAEWPGILRWAAEGARDWYENGLQPPVSVLEATDAYRQEMDAIGQFIRDRFHIGPGFAGVPVSEVYEIYQEWTKSHGEYAMSQRKLSKMLKERGYSSKKIGGVRKYEDWGIRDFVNNPAVDEDDEE